MDSKCKITYFLDREADEYTYLSDEFRPTKALLIVMFLQRLIYQQTEVFLKHSLGNQRQMDLKWSFCFLQIALRLVGFSDSDSNEIWLHVNSLLKGLGWCSPIDIYSRPPPPHYTPFWLTRGGEKQILFIRLPTGREVYENRFSKPLPFVCWDDGNVELEKCVFVYVKIKSGN